MKKVFRQTPLYRFLKFCNESNLEKNVLDCGAGGNMPPLSLFSYYGYKTTGIELSNDQISASKKYEKENNQNLHIEKGNMQDLTFNNSSFSFVYSYNSIFHMKKDDIEKSINEMKRVLKKDGLMFVNFLTTLDPGCGTGKDLGNNQYEQMERNIPTIHSYFDEKESDSLFKDMKILYKETRIIERMYEGQMIKQSYIDYIVKKVEDKIDKY